MAGYAIVNLRELEDAAEKFGLSPDVEARFGRRPLGAERAGVSYQRLAPNVRQPFAHRHGQQEELYVVVEGGGRVNVDGDVRELRQWDAVRVAPEVTRCFEAGDDGMSYLAFGAGDAGDRGETVPGWWG